MYLCIAALKKGRTEGERREKKKYPEGGAQSSFQF